MMSAASESDGAEVDGCSRAPESVTPDVVTLNPRGSEWRSLVKRAPLTAFQKRLREQLGLPTDRPVILSGHQAEFWHPGILAKWFAGAALARRVGGAFVWLHVDQDTNEPGVIEVPALDASGTLVKRSLTLIEATKDVPTGARPAQRIDAAAVKPARGETFATESVRAGVAKMVEMLNRHAAPTLAPTLALQYAAAIDESVRALARESDEAGAPIHSITTSQLAGTDAFAEMVELLRHDPVRAIEAHNHAAASVPEAGVRALGVKRASSAEQPPRVELPLWRVKPGAPRTPVMLSQLESIPIAELRPRALLMTGLARLGACDLFIHGTGGGVYDRITDAWFAEWLKGSEVGSELAPVAVATATVRLAFGESHGGVTEAESRAASHRAHHARHNPDLLDDEHAAHAKRDLVDRIARSTDRAERATLFREMHGLLDRVRGANGTMLGVLHYEATTAKRRAAEQLVVSERTWPFPLYPDAMLTALRRRIEQEMGT